MSNTIVHVWSSKTQRHGLPFVVCPRHHSAVVLDYADPSYEVHDVVETSAVCEKCALEDKVLAPLKVLYKHSQTLSAEELLTVLQALGYPSVKEAWLQLRVLQQSKEGAIPY